MSYLLDDDTRMLRDSAGRLFAGLDTLRTLRRLRDAGDTQAAGRGAWEDMTGLGLPGILVPEAFGGSGLGARAGIQVSEMMGRALAAGPFVASAVMAATAIAGGDNEPLKAAVLPEIARGVVVAVAAEERARHDPGAIDGTVASAEGDGFRLSGRKIAVLGGNVARKLIVAARLSDGQGIGLLLVDADAPGVAVTARMGIDGHPLVEVTFRDVRVDAANLIFAPVTAPALLDRIYDAGRLHLAAEMLGVAQEAFDRTVDYLKTRVQFGRKIGEFQALQHRAAILLGELEIARSVVMKAAALWDAGAPAAEAVSLAKARVGDIARHATTEAVQLHGGIGVTDDFDIGLFLKRARVASELLGDSAFHAERYARLRGV